MSEKNTAPKQSLPSKKIYEISALVCYHAVILADSEDSALAEVDTWENAWHDTGELVGVSDVEVFDIRDGEASDANVVARKCTHPTRRALKKENAALSAEVERLRGLLRPFADEAERWWHTVPGDHRSLCTEPGETQALNGSETAFTIGDLRRAAEALRAEAGKEDVSEAAGIKLVVDRSLQPGTAVLRSGKQQITYKLDEGKEP